MSVRRLVARLRTQDWAAASIELVIVVVGILIALQVSNWNQDRLDHLRAKDYFQRILHDLHTDRGNMDTTLAYWDAVSAYGRAAIANGENGVLVDGSAWKTLLAYYQASQTLPFVQADSDFNEMRSAGALELIADSNLRRQLAAYYSLQGVGPDSIIHIQYPAYRDQIRGLTPWAIQQYIWSHCYRESSYYDQGFIDCPAPVDESAASTILASFKQSPSLLHNLRSWMSTLRISSLVLANSREEASKLATKMKAAGG